MKIFTWMGFVALFLLHGCSFTQKVKTGLQAYEVKQYAVAAQLFQQEYASTKLESDKKQLAFLAGESFSKLNDQVNAAHWYDVAYKDGFGPQALEKKAEALMRQEQYAQVISTYEDLLKTSPGNAAYRSQVTAAKQANDWSKKPNDQVEVVPADFNTTAADYAATPIGAGKVLFTSDRDSRLNSETYLWTGRSYSDLYTWNRLTRKLEEFDEKINSPDNDGTATLSPDGNTIVFTRCTVDTEYDAWCRLFISQKQDDNWSTPKPLVFQKEKTNYGHPAFAANGTTIFFSSDLAGGSGLHDLYFSQLGDDGTWSEPVNLGNGINSEGEELYPTVYNDTLYYSSDHFAGLGGLDIFKTYLDQKGNWTPPFNLRAPINSGGDDFGFAVDTFSRKDKNVVLQGYFTSSRGGVSRSDDVFAFYVHQVETAVSVDSTPVVSTEPYIDYQVFITIKVMEPVYEIKDDPNSRKVENRVLPNGPIVVSEGLTDRRLVTDELGQLLLKLEFGKEYKFTARYRDHLAASFTINTNEIVKNPEHPITTINRLVILDPLVRNKEIVLENIFYDYDQWFIREDAKPSLNNLSNILKSNPAIRIQLASHTDCRGTSEYNLDLSQKRAQAAIDYLMSTGIPAKRLEAIGMGESVLADTCECEQCTEEQHQKNRRTTFKIID